ncbi:MULTISPECIES: bifunctional 2-C-methyl-D-erythritol 4-phosphate cytidylyltransferase/2-C-methyl-D-erythritol 2,4-cyclodiphosphate synthase [unclassified Rhizobium]|uniref:bifunctional 2-C-methyl-D-erythritol 4-phosphate cytidylyltransferase/2-C-methyl-D-erythritol 2,4-cyclodiphosphate synthase n=1 Tax=unclassified Rhizobium TaxID=2613769 RepID=UPI000EA8963B|nr:MULTISPECIES: bifunctional 2-C-methyl-D-erythritol 4-phosphate cytidylyltransferase/2-C-methyl-D-erythritol 2,4-cyclodiphosphate synthase [unclassified Rhizobium]AYG68173.1 bifunctional 2-C-methyl-D-erythritol 4-phosphate cytidylyltransferase/2-C-methyl-D-erythritol 2,4-cyclodiphosphate synthase [Rhizobium sp. CCGE531]AYG74555.1 bifunctional 2-C-methyl-D-erythritol 4-phosphate cytidylyltransferase/2-C-methyl-D-erythritol 2,4-cyclodiphosphate synthase [Rhizobium sp. CCGE532]
MTQMHSTQPLSVGIVIVAAGRGERSGSPEEGPKQYRPIGGRAVITHTLERFVTWPQTSKIVVVIHRDDERLLRSALEQVTGLPDVEIAFGGTTRQQSVLAGLRQLNGSGVTHVMIHDAVRPFFDHDLLDRVAAALAEGAPAVLPAMPVTDTLKRGDASGLVIDTVPRAGLHAAQTPQSFRFADILAAHEKAEAAGKTDFTDDAAIAEWCNLPVTLVTGSADNVKLTIKRDIAMADEKLSAGLLPDVRTGNGYDVHQLVPGDGVTLCGVFIPHDQKLKGHSDADVALHALTDALLATCGAGDIGDHFPPSDPQWKGAPSRIFIEHAAKIVRERGGTIMNADVSLIAEAPKIGPHRDVMRARLSEFLGISLERCSVKATTNETIGFVGRREGIAAIATATVVYRGAKT